MEKRRILRRLFVLAVSLSSFSLFTIEDPKFKISIAGVNHDLNGGLKPSEFAELTIESADERIEVSSIEITLARGNRAVTILTINSDSFDLGEFKEKAQPGDRIVVQIIKVSDTEDLLLPDNKMFIIKVN